MSLIQNIQKIGDKLVASFKGGGQNILSDIKTGVFEAEMDVNGGSTFGTVEYTIQGKLCYLYFVDSILDTDAGGFRPFLKNLPDIVTPDASLGDQDFYFRVVNNNVIVDGSAKVRSNNQIDIDNTLTPGSGSFTGTRGIPIRSRMIYRLYK